MDQSQYLEFLWLAYCFDGVIPVSFVRVLHVGLGIGPSVLLLLPRLLPELHTSSKMSKRLDVLTLFPKEYRLACPAS